MKLYVDKVLQELPPGLSDMLELEMYSSDQLTIFKSKNVFASPRSFSSYKFLLPFTENQPPGKVGTKLCQFEKHHLFPLNPGQFHASTFEGEVDTYLPIFIDQKYFRQIAETAFGKTDEIVFPNNNYPLSPQLQQLLHQFFEETTNPQKGSELILQSLNIQIVITLLREFENNCWGHQPTEIPHDQKCVNQAIDYLMANYREDFCLEEIAEIVNYSPYHFIRLFKSATGKTPFEFLMDIKIQKAKDMLQYTSKSITEVCFICGFNNRSHFSTTFKKKVGASPLEYRKACN